LKDNWITLIGILTTVFTIYSYYEILNYFKRYNIEFLEYGSISDLMLLGLRVNADTTVLKSVLIVATLFIYILLLIGVIKASEEKESRKIINANKVIDSENKLTLNTLFLSKEREFQVKEKANSIKLFLLSILCFTTLILIPNIKEDNISTKKRVTITFEKTPPLLCVGMLATTSDWLFLWDHKTKEPIIVSKAKVVKISTIVKKQPLIEVIHQQEWRKPKKPDLLIDMPLEIKLHNARLHKLKNLCGEDIKNSEFR